MKLFSAIVPCYNEEENIEDFYNAFLENEAFFTEHDISFEILFIDDGSQDATVERVKELHKKDARVKLYSFTRNFGKEAAIYAGLTHAKGDYIATMDADLQDPPSLLPEMFSYLESGEYDSVATRRVDRKGEPKIRSFFARRFYHLINRMSRTEIVDGARDFRLMTRRFVDSVLEVKEYNRFSKGIFSWVGYRTKWMEFTNVERKKGETKWSFWRLFIYAIEGIIAFSTAPLAIASFAGILFCLLAFIFIVVIVVRAAIFGDPTSGWPSTISIMLLVSGVQLFCLGIVGEYISKTYLEVKKRPIYLLKDTLE